MLHNGYFLIHAVHMKVPVTDDGVLLYDYFCEMVYVRCIFKIGEVQLLLK